MAKGFRLEGNPFCDRTDEPVYSTAGFARRCFCHQNCTTYPGMFRLHTNTCWIQVFTMTKESVSCSFHSMMRTSVFIQRLNLPLSFYSSVTMDLQFCNRQGRVMWQQLQQRQQCLQWLWWLSSEPFYFTEVEENRNTYCFKCSEVRNHSSTQNCISAAQFR